MTWSDLALKLTSRKFWAAVAAIAAAVGGMVTGDLTVPQGVAAIVAAAAAYQITEAMADSHWP